MSESERRCQPRIASTIEATVFLGGGWRNAVLTDFSLSGALLRLGLPYGAASGKSCLLRLPCCAKLFNGLVVHSTQNVIGIKFIGIGQVEHDALERLVVDAAQNPPVLLDRDIAALLSSK